MAEDGFQMLMNSRVMDRQSDLKYLERGTSPGPCRPTPLEGRLFLIQWSYCGNDAGALTCCQPSPLSDFSIATRSRFSWSVSSRGIMVLSRCGFLMPP